MKKILLCSIRCYQYFFSPLLTLLLSNPKLCRFTPSCSEYAYAMINKFGIRKGGILAIKRLFSCQPFSKQYV